ncbi:MAG: twin-arginine translocase subunit TatC, partial [Proteobacteria bacterium]|nr:twin-arginine translocase subunit TatC [Pseudomonadota bacterium]
MSDTTSDTADVHKMPLLDHLIELRQRMLYSFIALFVAFLICFFFAQVLFDFLVQPLADILIEREGVHGARRLIFTDLTEVFFTHIKIAFFFGAFASSPIFLTQLWLFIAPGL